ncbi:helix-turn-helix domain-containing protein [Actinomadura kijaniata]|uniref:AraC-like DNA-binding protein n=1 Tax=Actinomadura namibiensis TaxID=182080 RepID=A0A7W3LX94_ACTNM|nr:helix-turn-helix domain-containing protein [Actinomadura namibiensis]MBA8955890.1 AraC-like DNA-binding protein [Actinomadura namibiensis]
MATLVTTVHHPLDDQADHWRRTVSAAFGPLRLDPPDRPGFAALLAARELGPVLTGDVRAPAHRVRRSARQVDRDTRECYKLGLVLRGSCLLRQNGREALAGPGDLVLYDLTRPVEIDFRAHHIFTALVPHGAVALPPHRVWEMAGTLLTDQTRSGRLVASLLSALAADGDAADGPHAHHLGEAIAELLTGALCERLGRAAPPPPVEAALLRDIQEWIERRLADPALSPETIARAHHLSVRQLYRIFQVRGDTVARYVRTRRLERCRRELRDPRAADRRIGAIAARWGFADASSFSRAFRAAYGVSPSAYRDLLR